MRYSRTITLTSQPVSDELYGDLASHFDPAELLSIAFLTGVSNLVNRLHATFLTDVDASTLEELGSRSCPIPLPTAPTAAPRA